jgi:hypothetical protein
MDEPTMIAALEARIGELLKRIHMLEYVERAARARNEAALTVALAALDEHDRRVAAESRPEGTRQHERRVGERCQSQQAGG